MTKEKFLAYLTVRDSGETNMFDIPRVIELAGVGYQCVNLTKEDCLDIMENFGKYLEEFDIKEN